MGVQENIERFAGTAREGAGLREYAYALFKDNQWYQSELEYLRERITDLESGSILSSDIRNRERACSDCEHFFLSADKQPCRDCFLSEGHPYWEPKS